MARVLIIDDDPDSLLSPISTDEFLAVRDAAIERTVSHS